MANEMGIEPNYLYRVLPKLVQEKKVKRQGQGWHPAVRISRGIIGAIETHVLMPTLLSFLRHSTLLSTGTTPGS